MGRKKITIQAIPDDRTRQVTLNKRKFGLMKKAYELSVLCSCEVALIIFDNQNKLHEYASNNVNETLVRYAGARGNPTESHTNETLRKAVEKRGKKGKGVGAGATAVAEAPQFELTPRTIKRYQEINEEFDKMIRETRGNPQFPAPPQPVAAPRMPAPPARTDALVAAPAAPVAAAPAPPLPPGARPRERPHLRVMIPGQGQTQFPPGTQPRMAPAAEAGDSALPGTTGLPLLTPGLTALLGAPAGPSPMNIFSPGITWPLPSPSVLHGTAAGDLHLSADQVAAAQSVMTHQMSWEVNARAQAAQAAQAVAQPSALAQAGAAAAAAAATVAAASAPMEGTDDDSDDDDDDDDEDEDDDDDDDEAKPARTKRSASGAKPAAKRTRT